MEIVVQRAACDVLSRLVRELDAVQARLDECRSRCQSLGTCLENRLQERVRRANAVVEATERRLKQVQADWESAQQRITALHATLEAVQRQGQLPESAGDLLRQLDQYVERAVRPVRQKLKKLLQSRDALEEQLRNLEQQRSRVSSQQEESQNHLHACQTGADHPVIADQVARRRQALKDEYKRSKQELVKLRRQIESVNAKLSDLRAQLADLQAADADWRQRNQKPVLAKIFDPTWWSGRFKSYEEKIHKVETTLQKTIATRDRLKKEANERERLLRSMEQDLHRRLAHLDDEIRRELARHCQQRILKLQVRIEELIESMAPVREQLEARESKIKALQDQEREEALQAERDGLAQIVRDLENECVDAAQECERLKAESSRVSAKYLRRRDRLPQWLSWRPKTIETELEVLQDQSRRLEQEQHDLAQRIQHVLEQTGLPVDEPLTAKRLEHIRAELEQRSAQPRLHGAWIRRNVPPATDRVLPHDAIQGSVTLDLVRRAEDDEQGRPGLRSQLRQIRAKFPGQFFPDLQSGQDILEGFREAFFPPDLPVGILVWNATSEQGEQSYYVGLRPYAIGPRLEPLLPPGLSLAITGNVFFDKRANRHVMMVQSIVPISDAPPRPFELAVVAQFLSRNGHSRDATAENQDDLFASSQFQQLPSIARNTAVRLSLWRDYLTWKERLTQLMQRGLRFVGKPQLIRRRGWVCRFLVVAPSREDLQRRWRLLRRGDPLVCDLRCSTDRFDFRPRQDEMAEGVILGDACHYELVQQPPVRLSLPDDWEHSCYAWADFFLSDDWQEEIPDNEEAARQWFEKRIAPRMPEEGFIVPSIIGDLALVRRLSREIDNVERQMGFAPLLSLYLFDIGQADQPHRPVRLGDSEWFTPLLNEDQKKAVELILSVPDIGLIQGPPGTGKTTVIAEAAAQLTRLGQKVLIASQANIAVDNVLERLPPAISIRAIRLGRRGEIDNPYSPTNAIATYYRTIAGICEQRWLSRWRSLDADIRDLERYQRSLTSLQTQLHHIRREREELQVRLSSLTEREQAVREQLADVTRHAMLADNTRRFLEAWRNADPTGTLEECPLPPRFEEAFREQLESIISQVAELGLAWNNVPVATTLRHANL
ncbi:MAG: hypothetical protein C4297_01530 [Gemmataceae bacterium]